MEKMDVPDPVIKIAIEPKSKADLEKMGMGLNKLAQEDPSFGYSRDEETNQTVIEGMGELHLEIIVDRLRREFKVECEVGAPQVNYREGISRQAEVRDGERSGDGYEDWACMKRRVVGEMRGLGKQIYKSFFLVLFPLTLLLGGPICSKEWSCNSNIVSELYRRSAMCTRSSPEALDSLPTSRSASSPASPALALSSRARSREAPSPRSTSPEC